MSWKLEKKRYIDLMIVLIVAIVIEFIVLVYSVFFLGKDIIPALLEYNNYWQDFNDFTNTGSDSSGSEA